MKKLVKLVMGDWNKQSKMEFKFPNEKMIYHFVRESVSVGTSDGVVGGIE